MRLSEVRARKLYTPANLAQAAGVSRGHIYGVEAGRWLPSLELVRKLCDLLEVENPEDVDEFKAAIERSARGKEPARV
jgi:DNA-binding XRE family transcriptional regulator